MVYSGRLLPDTSYSALSWFDSGYILLPVSGLRGYCFRVQRNAWSSVVHAVRQSRNFHVFTGRSTSDPEVDSRCNCGFSIVAAHLQGRRHPFRAAEADLMVHTVQISMEIPQLPVDKVVDVPLRSSTSLLCLRGRSTWSRLFSTS